ncbi:MAG: hypothetical protein WBD74_08810, partial [Candidatus Aquilonibacter sp.]
NDSGIETFRGNFYRYLARELIQNSLDARYDPSNPVTVKFALETISKGDLPDAAALSLALRRCAEFWSGQPKTVSFFEKAEDALDASKITCLRVGDYNTKGVTGSDDDRDGNWYNLIKCAGSSNKGGGEGGSFGIGKNAPFAASHARTVLYSTKLKNGAVAFQGVAQIATHENGNGERLQSTGFLGRPDGTAVRNVTDIPGLFEREEQGTDIWILAYNFRGDWRDDLMYSVLESFWPAIRFGELVVDVGDIRVDASSLEEHLRQYSTQQDFTGHVFYQAYSDPTVREVIDIPQLGECSIYVRSGEGQTPKRFAMIRKAGMVVTARRFQSPIPYAGVFLCRNDQGNAKLREMEPPRHDEWDKDLPEPGANRKAYNAIGDAIRKVLHELNPLADAEALVIPGLERYLPDIEPDSADPLWNGGKDRSQSESHDGRPPVQVDVKPVTLKPRPTATPQLVEVPNIGGGVDDSDDDDGESIPPGEDEGGLQPGGRRDARAGQGDLPQGETRGRRPTPQVFIPSRAFVSDARLGKYTVVLHPPEDFKAASLSAVAIGEDQKSVLHVRSARIVDGDPVPTSEGFVGPIDLCRGERVTLEIFVSEPSRYAIEVFANALE